MAHEAQERYSDLVMAKLRAECVLADGFVFNTDYEGDPTAGAVQIPVRDTEVKVSDYDKANGLAPTNGETKYTTLVINKDKGINELIDGYDAESVPDKLVADRLDSGSYALGYTLDVDGGTTLLAGSTTTNVEVLSADNIYDAIVDIRADMTKAHIPNDGKRYLLVTPDAYSLVLKCPQFVPASELGDEVKKTGAVGKISGFRVKEWSDSTANLAMLAGHPKFATRVKEWKVKVKVQSLDGSGKYIGACAVQGRMVYGHKVLRSEAIRAVYAPGSLAVGLAMGTTGGTTIATVSAGNTGTTYAYRLNPAVRATYGMTKTAYGGTDLTSGTTEIQVSAGDVIEIVNLSSSKVVSVGYVTVGANHIAPAAPAATD